VRHEATRVSRPRKPCAESQTRRAMPNTVSGRRYNVPPNAIRITAAITRRRRFLFMGGFQCAQPGMVRAESARMGNLLWLIIVILLILWLGGFAFHTGAGLIHILPVIVVIVLIFQLITGRRAI